MRSECGARGRSRKPFPGGSGSPPGRHNDRPPRSAVDSRQAEAGNARYARSQEARLLELSQRRMRSPWRVPRRGAERRAAREESRCRAADELRGLRTLVCDARTMAGAPIGAPPPFLVHGHVRKPDATFRDHARGRPSFLCPWWLAKLGCREASRERFSVSSLPDLILQSLRCVDLSETLQTFDGRRLSTDRRGIGE